MSSPLGSKERPLRVCVVGSGPSGFYAAAALLNQTATVVEVDMIDRLPTPYGLVRGGVAPDHQKIKSVVAVYEKTALKPGFRFFGNVQLGRDVQVADLERVYDQVVYAVGNESDKRLGIPGEDLQGSFSATEFVAWYNGHPDYRERQFDLSVDAAAVVGIGNVAMDVVRILSQDPEILAKTDIADYAVEALRRSKIKRVYLLGRRGPVQAAFSPKEIEEIGELQSADLVVEPKELELDETSKAQLSDPEAKKNFDYLTEAAARGQGARAKKVLARFCVSPAELLGQGGRVAAVKIERNRLEPDGKGSVKARGSGQFETLEGVGLVFRSVGYNGIPIAGVPFDEKAGRIPNKDGRVLRAAGGEVLPNHFVVGWAKRGPSGLVGTNRPCSEATAKLMLEDAAGKSGAPEKTAAAAEQLIRAKQPRCVSFQDWKRLDKLELERGKAKGKIREKFTRVGEMLEALQGQPA